MGKAFLTKSIHAALEVQRGRMSAFATSKVAASLIHHGWTAHSPF